jgi:hypothetical protein
MHTGNSPKLYLLEGPLCGLIEARRDLIERMAKTLSDNPEGLSSDRDAIRVLVANGYGFANAAILAGEARMVAYQEIVAREMSQP